MSLFISNWFTTSIKSFSYGPANRCEQRTTTDLTNSSAQRRSYQRTNRPRNKITHHFAASSLRRILGQKERAHHWPGQGRRQFSGILRKTFVQEAFAGLEQSTFTKLFEGLGGISNSLSFHFFKKRRSPPSELDPKDTLRISGTTDLVKERRHAQ